MIYFASPYDDPSPEVRINRFLAALAATARLLQRGLVVFSPIVYSHQFAAVLGNGFEAWSRFDLEMLDHCDEIYVLMLDGWRESKGVSKEIMYASDRGKQIKYLHDIEVGR